MFLVLQRSHPPAETAASVGSFDSKSVRRVRYERYAPSFTASAAKRSSCEDWVGRVRQQVTSPSTRTVDTTGLTVWPLSSEHGTCVTVTARF